MPKDFDDAGYSGSSFDRRPNGEVKLGTWNLIFLVGDC